MRWILIAVMALVSTAAAQQPPPATSASGTDISARDGDRILVNDDASVEIVRRRQATIRTIYSQKERLLIVLVDYSKPGAFPDGEVDWAYNFYQMEGAWPLGPRWEALTAMVQYEGGMSRPRGLAFETPRGLMQIVPGQNELATPDPRAAVVVSHRGSSSGPRTGLSFAEAEKVQLADFVRSKASGAVVGTAMPPAGSGATGTGTMSLSTTLGSATVSGGARGRDNAPPAAEREASTNHGYIVQPNQTPPPAGREIPASDGDRVIVDDDARIQIVRRRQATIRTIFHHEQRLLILLADHAKPGQFPDGEVDSAFNFYEIEGNWPLPPRWEALTTILRYEGDPQFPGGYALATPQGVVHLSPGRPGLRQPDPMASSVLWFRGSSSRLEQRMSFAEAEKYQLSEASRRKSAP